MCWDKLNLRKHIYAYVRRTDALDSDATAPEFISFFAGARFFATPQPLGGVFVLSQSGQANRILFGPDGNDVGSGGDLTDVLFGDDGEDNLQGAFGNDFVCGGDGDDIVRGDAGDDVMVGQEGSDLAIGGAGSNIFEFSSYPINSRAAISTSSLTSR